MFSTSEQTTTYKKNSRVQESKQAWLEILRSDLTAIFKDKEATAENYNTYVYEIFDKHAPVISKTFVALLRHSPFVDMS